MWEGRNVVSTSLLCSFVTVEKPHSLFILPLRWGAISFSANYGNTNAALSLSKSLIHCSFCPSGGEQSLSQRTTVTRTQLCHCRKASFTVHSALPVGSNLFLSELR